MLPKEADDGNKNETMKNRKKSEFKLKARVRSLEQTLASLTSRLEQIEEANLSANSSISKHDDKIQKICAKLKKYKLAAKLRKEKINELESKLESSELKFQEFSQLRDKIQLYLAATPLTNLPFFDADVDSSSNILNSGNKRKSKESRISPSRKRHKKRRLNFEILESSEKYQSLLGYAEPPVDAKPKKSITLLPSQCSRSGSNLPVTSASEPSAIPIVNNSNDAPLKKNLLPPTSTLYPRLRKLSIVCERIDLSGYTSSASVRSCVTTDIDSGVECFTSETRQSTPVSDIENDFYSVSGDASADADFATSDQDSIDTGSDQDSIDTGSDQELEQEKPLVAEKRKKRMYHCQFCKMTFSAYRDVERHMESAHGHHIEPNSPSKNYHL